MDDDDDVQFNSPKVKNSEGIMHSFKKTFK